MSPPIDVASPQESLAFAVRAIAREAGFEIGHGKLIAALGFEAPAVPSSTATPTMFGRDARLIDAGRQFGMQIREVHPPEAARGLEVAAEFDQHFDASYRPLILRALENNQGVIAWRGWAGERELSWGWIRAACNQGFGFRGATIWSERELNSLRNDLLVRPAVQLYIVERVSR
ncbi:MAG: hypothetical protein AAB363_10975 [Planctomycetota bacterium]